MIHPVHAQCRLRYLLFSHPPRYLFVADVAEFEGGSVRLLHREGRHAAIIKQTQLFHGVYLTINMNKPKLSVGQYNEHEA